MEAADKINAYTCEKCARKIITRTADEGVTPFMIPCIHCDGTAQSAFYRVPQHLTPTHEWYKPGPVELTAMQFNAYLIDTVEHVKDGGLLMRKIGGPTWLEGWKARNPKEAERQPYQARLMNDDPGPRLLVHGCKECEHYYITLWENAQYEGSCTGIFGDHDSAVAALAEAAFWGHRMGVPVEIEEDLVSLVADGDVQVRGRDGEVYVGPGANEGSDTGGAGAAGVCGGGDRADVQPRGGTAQQDEASQADDSSADS